MSQWSIWVILPIGGAVFLGLHKITGDRQRWLRLALPAFLLCGFCCCESTLDRQAREQAFCEQVEESTSCSAVGRVVKLTIREERLEYLLEDVTLTASGQELYLYRLLVYLPVNFTGMEGDRIRAVGVLQRFDRPTNPGQFDYAAYQASVGVNLLLNECKGTVLVRGERKMDGILGNLRRYALGVYMKISPEGGGTMAALTLGDKTYLPDERYQLYLDSGIGHILTLSGLHLSLFGVGLYGVLRKRLTLPAWPAAVMMSAGIFGYVALIGGGISAMRAAIALLVSLLAGCIGKTYDSLSAAALGMVCILAEFPLQITRPSFWLSFGAVIAMGGILPALNRWLKPVRRLSKALIPVLVIQLALMPVTAINQYTIQPYSVFLNMAVVPMMGMLLGGSIAVLLVGMVWPAAAVWLALPVELAFEVIDRLCSFSLSLPWSEVVAGMPSVGTLLIYGVILAGLLGCVCHRNRLDWDAMEMAEYGEETAGEDGDRKRRFLRLSTAAALIGRSDRLRGNVVRETDFRNRWLSLVLVSALLIATLIVDIGDRDLAITFLDVGQGDCICIETPNGTAIMVDGGSTSSRNVGEYRILPYLKWAGISELDYLIITHLDEDHVNGVEELLVSGFPVGTILVSAVTTDEDEVEELRAIIEEKGTKVVYISREMKIKCGKVELECIYPSLGSRPDSENGASVVLRLTYDRFSCLLTGDIEGSGEEELIESLEGEAPVTLLKVAHHGSKYSTPDEFLETVSPVAAVISCGANNFYGHPHEELLDRLWRAGCEIYCTATCGAVMVRTDGVRWSIKGYCGEKMSEQVEMMMGGAEATAIGGVNR